MVKNENFKSIAKFIHENLLCQWGAIEIIITDNAPQYIQAADYLAKIFHIHHIKISPYNSKKQRMRPVTHWILLKKGSSSLTKSINNFNSFQHRASSRQFNPQPQSSV